MPAAVGWVWVLGVWAGPGLVWMGCVGQCVGVLWLAGCCVDVLRTGPVAAGVRVYSCVIEMCSVSCLCAVSACLCRLGCNLLVPSLLFTLPS